MASYVLDTGTLLGFVRGAYYGEYVDQTYAPSQPPNIAVCSVVSIAEMRSFAVRLAWGAEKLARLDEILRGVPTVNINRPAIIEKFAEIDAYRLNRHPKHNLPAGTNNQAMGDNDIWIAATASVLRATLLTTDGDFDFLNNVFLKVIRIDPKMKPPAKT
ncbi:MAG: type II toxin-antitoxin system VapC family toxin [Verrucomicrobia bacterium]|nr:type II toxin-antitoxin system VapC family toxin [Verrucomicrobiota bacterium]